MRIAYLSHFYPPNQNAGIEQNTHAIASGMLAAGHSVKVLCIATVKDPGYYHGFTEDEWEGVTVRRLKLSWQQPGQPTHNLFDNPFLADRVREFLLEFKPDLVHITSMYALGARIAEVPDSLGLPSVMTLHDFWLICPRLTLKRHDGEICNGQVSALDCQDCLLKGSASYRALQRVSSQALLDKVYGSIIRKPGLATRMPGLRGWGVDVERRRSVIREGVGHIDHFLAPARHIAGSIRDAGMPIDIEISPYGHRLDWLSRYQDRPADGELRFGFMGQVRPHKGVHLLIQGFQKNRFPENVKLRIYGGLEEDPEYVFHLRELARGNPNITFEGPFRRPEMPRVLPNIDVLVVPSTWPDVAPLVVHEAFAARKPVLASNMGGLPEFVRPGEGGLIFDVKDHRGVQQALAQVHAGGAELLQSMRAAIPAVRTDADEQKFLEGLYRRLIADRASERMAS
ncbi:MAG: glycosyltransferase [Bryobacterales bacterium]